MDTKDPRDHRNTSTDNPSPPNTPDSERERNEDRRDVEHEGDSDRKANPPNTTIDGVTAPKFGSAGSGGAEYEPAPGT